MLRPCFVHLLDDHFLLPEVSFFFLEIFFGDFFVYLLMDKKLANSLDAEDAINVYIQPCDNHEPLVHE